MKEVDRLRAEVDRLQQEAQKLRDINEGWRQGNETFLKNELAVALRNVEALKNEQNRIVGIATEMDQAKTRQITMLTAQLEAYRRLDNGLRTDFSKQYGGQQPAGNTPAAGQPAATTS